MIESTLVPLRCTFKATSYSKSLPPSCCKASPYSWNAVSYTWNQHDHSECWWRCCPGVDGPGKSGVWRWRVQERLQGPGPENWWASETSKCPITLPQACPMSCCAAIVGGGGTSPPPSEVYMVFVKVATHSWCACSEILDTSCSLQPSSASLGELRL
jgi:hypothetical protein